MVKEIKTKLNLPLPPAAVAEGVRRLRAMIDKMKTTDDVLERNKIGGEFRAWADEQHAAYNVSD